MGIGDNVNNNEGVIYVDDDNGSIMAVVIKDSCDLDGVKFLTPDDYSQQLAFMHHPQGHVILPHVHNVVKREILYTKEVLIIKKGVIRCDFYDDNKNYLKSIQLEKGDIILLVSGGHGFECIEETIMIEVKQGPYAGEGDKTRFEQYKGDLRMVKYDR